MPKKPTPNINFMLKTAKEYIDGTGDELSFMLDYGYELEKRYKAMVKEDSEKLTFSSASAQFALRSLFFHPDRIWFSDKED